MKTTPPLESIPSITILLELVWSSIIVCLCKVRRTSWPRSTLNMYPASRKTIQMGRNRMGKPGGTWNMVPLLDGMGELGKKHRLAPLLSMLLLLLLLLLLPCRGRRGLSPINSKGR